LFGSRSRQDHGKRSDIDLAIDCKNARAEDWLKIIALVENADTLLKVDCVRLDVLQEKDQLKQNIKQHGKIIYSKEYGFMNKEHWQDLFTSLKRAIERLREVYDKADATSKEVAIYIDAAIQRFEFTAELFWKVLKKFLHYEQIEANTPREVLKQSYAARIIDQEKIWLEMMNDRTLTSHTYQEALAKEIFIRIKSYLPLFEEGYEKLEKRYEKM